MLPYLTCDLPVFQSLLDPFGHVRLLQRPVLVITIGAAFGDHLPFAPGLMHEVMANRVAKDLHVLIEILPSRFSIAIENPGGWMCGLARFYILAVARVNVACRADGDFDVFRRRKVVFDTFPAGL